MTGMSVAHDAAVRARLLVVDDDEGVLNFLRRVLTSEGFEVTLASSVADARAAIETERPSLVLLDLGLADDDGLELLAELRSGTDVPVIVLTGRGAEHDRVLGLRMGADDYIVKPFSYLELVARIDTVLRRSSQRPVAAPRVFGSIVIDTASREVSKDGRPIDTTAREFDLLAFLTASPRQVFSRQQLLEQVWASSAEWQDPATVTEHVRRLRGKLEDDPDQPRSIVTVRGVGYRFEP
jgi:two-component system phosphate regulon response regulator PhoB